VRFLEGGAVFFRPQHRHYGALRPHASELTRAVDPLGELSEAAARRSLDVSAWTVFCHNYRLGRRHPECVERNAFGDPYLTDLCPAHPEVRSFAVALATDIARYGVRSLVAESLHYHPLEHGFHHERYLIELGARASFLLGLCFCEHCRAAAASSGVDAEGVRKVAVAAIDEAFAAAPRSQGDDGEGDEMAALAGGELEGYLRARAATVASLVAEVRAALEGSGVRLAFMDPSGATKGYATGRPVGGPAASISWRLGIDLAAITAATHELEILGYCSDPSRLRLDLDAYAALAPATPTGVILRPTAPDCTTPANLAAKVRLCREREIARVAFYHYGLMRLESLDWIGAALASPPVR
jgi:hypothetical protein